MHSLVELAASAGVTPRTVRYYIAQGLLPAPVGQGPGARYTDGHLSRLQLIRRLQDEHLPLAEIRARIEALDDDTVAQLVAGPQPPPPAPSDDALRYIQRVLGEASPPRPQLHRPLQGTAMAPPASGRFERRIPDGFPLPGERSLREAPAPYPDTSAPSLPSRLAPTTDRSTWERIGLTPDLELHIRRPLDRRTNKRLEELLAFARELFAGN